MTGTTRIRWEDDPDGPMAASTGYVGTLEPLVFQIWRPSLRSGEWTLTARLPGDGDKAVYGDGPDELKAAAERWLSGFIASLGAVFPPGPDEQFLRQPLIHDLSIVLAGALHPGAQLTPGARLVASRLRDVLGIGDGDPLYGRELTGAKDIEAKLSAALGVTRISPPEDGD